MTHVSRAAAVVHVIGFSFPKAYTLHSTVGYSVVPQQIVAKAGNLKWTRAVLGTQGRVLLQWSFSN